MRLNFGPGTWYAEGWCNVDVVANDQVHPDLVVPFGEPLPIESDSCEQVYCGHVLEHIPWPDLGPILAELRRVLHPDGELLVVGPDVFRSIQRWHEGTEPWDIVTTVLEYHGRNMGFEGDTQWPNARHWWNCDEGRVVDALTAAHFVHVEPLPVADRIYDRDGIPGWPVVGYAPWQCAVKARKA